MNENKTARVLAWRAQEIPAQIEQAFAEAVDPETGEIVDETALQKIETLTAQKTVAVTDLAWFVKQADTVMIAHLDAVMAELKARKARIEKARDIGQKVLESFLTPGEKIETDFVTISWRKSEAVVVECAPELLPDEFQRIKVEADKAKLKQAIKQNRTIEGVHIESRQSLQIK